MKWRIGNSNLSRLREMFDRSSGDDDFSEIVNGSRNLEDIHLTECVRIGAVETGIAYYNRLIPRYSRELEFFLNILFPKNLNCISCKKPISKSNPYSLCKDCYEKVGLLKYTCSRCSKPIVREFRKDDIKEKNAIEGEFGKDDFKAKNARERNLGKGDFKAKDARERLLSRFSNENRHNCSCCMNDGCDFCRERNFTFDKNISCFSYNEVSKNFILPLKYNRKTFLAEITSRIMIEKLKFEDEIGNINLNEIDYIIAVPLSDKRIKKRGFNQSEILAREISHHFAIPYFSGLKRTKNTKRLFSLNMDERKKELEGAFTVDEKYYLFDLNEKSCLFYLNDMNCNENKKNAMNDELQITKGNIEIKKNMDSKKIQSYRFNILKNSNVLLIDDIFTTGSTLDEISKELKKAGVSHIYTMTMLIKN